MKYHSSNTAEPAVGRSESTATLRQAEAGPRMAAKNVARFAWFAALVAAAGAQPANPAPDQAGTEPAPAATQTTDQAAAATTQLSADQTGSAPAQVNFDYFHSQLEPYGNWVEVPGRGWCWSPAVATADAGWRPYCDQGQWAYTDNGWFWQSEYPWGDIAFHYGRWYREAGYGWMWVPDYTWAPAWVSWRNAEAAGFCGWAPLPPGALIGVRIGGLALEADFGLAPDAFVFVSFDHFWGHDYRHMGLERSRVNDVFHHSVILNGYRREGGRVIVEGLGRDRMAQFTHHDVRAVQVHEIRAREERAHIEVRRAEIVRHEVHPQAHPVEHREAQGRPPVGPAAHGGKPAPVPQHQPEPHAKPSVAPVTHGRTPGPSTKSTTQAKQATTTTVKTAKPTPTATPTQQTKPAPVTKPAATTAAKPATPTPVSKPAVQPKPVAQPKPAAAPAPKASPAPAAKPHAAAPAKQPAAKPAPDKAQSKDDKKKPVP